MTSDQDLRPDPEMEGQISSWLSDTDLSSTEAELGFDRVLDEFPVTPQTRRRFLGRWLQRDEGVRRRTDGHDQPPATRRTRLMFSATGLVAAFAVLALAVNVVTTDTSPPQAGSSATLSVAADGSGDHTTITEAVAAASDGDTITVKPGTYTEAIIIDKDISISGDGPLDEIVITAPEDGPTHPTRFGAMGDVEYALLLLDADSMISNLTLRGEGARLVVDGGVATIEDLFLDDVGQTFAGSWNPGGLIVNGGATATIRGNTLDSGGSIHIFESSDAFIESNELIDGPAIAGAFGDGSIIRDNEIGGTGVQGISFLGPTKALLEGNRISERGDGIVQGTGSPTGLEPTIRGNTISGTRTGINVPTGATPQISDNVLTDNGIGMVIYGSPTLTNNSVTDGEVGLSVRFEATPVLSGNTICGSPVNLQIIGDAVDIDLSGNEICEDAPTS